MTHQTELYVVFTANHLTYYKQNNGRASKHTAQAKQITT